MEYMAYCGLLCNKCPIFIAAKNNDEAAKEKLAAEYSNENFVFTAEDMNCEGCFSEKNGDSKMCGDCEIRNCAEQKKPSNCGSCEDFPCGVINRLLPGDSENMLRLKEISGGKKIL